MKIKFLPVITSLLFISIAVASCLGSNDSIEYDPDATIKAFEIDTIYGVNYKFTIDQIKGEIYNVDSVPMSADTIINKILITTINTYSGWVITEDTLLNINDSINFLNTMEEPLKFKVFAPDAVTAKEYTVEVRRHLQDPDSLTWKNLSAEFPGTAFDNSKTVVLGDEIRVYISNTSYYSSSPDNGKDWSLTTNVNLPANIKLHSLLRHNDRLYVLADGNKMFESSNGVEWEESALSGNVVALISAFETEKVNGIAAIIDDNGTNKFAISDESVSVWDIGENAPENFPVENISSSIYTTPTGIIRALILGKPVDAIDDAIMTIPWFSYEGKEWIPIATDSEYYIPPMNRPTVMYYAGKLYAYGDKFETFYTSNDSGLTWNEVEEKFMFTDNEELNLDFAGRTNYSSVVDDSNYIWIIWNNYNQENVQHGNEVYKGRLNKLGFLIQD